MNKRFYEGGRGDMSEGRTDDLLNAIQALSQLSHGAIYVNRLVSLIMVKYK
jgi:hypothetical protein